jgi:hypothetical protein
MNPKYTKVIARVSVPTFFFTAVHNVKILENPTIKNSLYSYCIYNECKKIDTTIEPHEVFE